MRYLIDKLEKNNTLTPNELRTLLLCNDTYLFKRARLACINVYGNQIFTRGLIELTSFCKNDCYYCGLRRSNSKAQRYRLTKEQILECCRIGYSLGFRTFVLQGGEDPHFSDDKLCEIIRSIRNSYPECAITLSVGERSAESYKKLFDSGAQRYLLRHETANELHYRTLHPLPLSLRNRKDCLKSLKTIGFQVGCGFMVGSKDQTLDHIVEDLLFINDFKPAMVGVGPFIPHKDTPFGNNPAGSLHLTLNCLAILRLMRPNLLLPSTTALSTLDPEGRMLGLLAGANVVMPNLSPIDVRKKYMLYDNKASTGGEAAESRATLQKQISKIGYNLSNSRGDPIDL